MSVDFVMKTVGSEIGGANGLAAQVVAVHAKNTALPNPTNGKLTISPSLIWLMPVIM